MFQGNCANNQSGDSLHSTAIGEQDTQTTRSALDKTGRTLDWCNVAFPDGTYLYFSGSRQISLWGERPKLA